MCAVHRQFLSSPSPGVEVRPVPGLRREVPPGGLPGRHALRLPQGLALQEGVAGLQVRGASWTGSRRTGSFAGTHKYILHLKFLNKT